MWIKLISPKVSLRPMDSEWKRRMSPPLSLLVLSALTPAAHKVTMEDENVEKLNLKDTPDLVGVTVKADTFNRSAEIAENYRAKGIPVIVGGIHPTAVPEQCAEIADSVFVGEAEELWEDVVRDATAGKLKKRYRRVDAPDMSTIPIPDWSLLNESNYLFTNTLRISRGCPWKCDFCYNSAGNVNSSYRMKPIEGIVREIESLGVRHIMFIDDNFIGDPLLTKQLLRRMKGMNITWHTAVSANIIQHLDILDMMAESGCKSLFIGFESVNAENLKNSSKAQNKVERYEEIIRETHQRKMLVNASVVFGFDNDTTAVFPNTVEWLIDNKVETMTAHILTPYPGTVLYERLLAENRIFDHNLDHYNTAHAVFRPKLMSVDELEKGYLRSYSSFYSWVSILKRCPPIGSGQIAAYLQFAVVYRKYGKFLSRIGRFCGMRRVAKLAKAIAYGKNGARLGQRRKYPAKPAAAPLSSIRARN